jgi:ArsR family transcriptional regulator, arsenate/arsenite/antimonite-responsive transcriptional repressor
MDPCYSNIPRVRRGDLAVLPASEAWALASVAKALSDPIRVQIVHLLDQRPDLCTCEFEELLGLGQSRVSYHLKLLLDAGIITRETYGTWSHYRLRTPHLLDQLMALRMAAVDSVGD